MKGDSYNGWDATGAYLLAYAMPLKNIYLTGKTPPTAPQLSAAQAQTIILDGRGWTNKDRNSGYDQLDGDALFERLGSWSPTVRERAALALARRKNIPLQPLMEMLASPSLAANYGACEAIISMKGAAAAAVPALRKALKNDDLWLRIKAAEALANIGQPAMDAVPELLQMIAQGPTEKDPRNMQQRYLSFSVFGVMLKRNLDGVDREQLRTAVLAGLQNQDARARGTIGNIYQQLSYDEIKPLLPAIYEAIVTPAPSDVMFASEIRLAGLNVLAKNRIREGMPLCLDVMELDKWGKQERVKKCLDSLAIYGAAAKPMLPQLHKLEKELIAHTEAASMQEQIYQLQGLIKTIENSNDTVELRSIK